MKTTVGFAFATLLVASLASCKKPPPPMPDPPPVDTPASPPPTASAPAAPAWAKVTSVAGRFEVMMPAGAKEEKSTDQTAAGPVDTIAYSVESSDHSYYAAFADYPVGLVTAANRERVLDGARDGASGNVGGTIESEKKVSIDGSPGRDIVINVASKSVRVRMRMTLVQSRLYIIQVLGQGPQGVTGADPDKFFDSFHFTNKGPAAIIKKPLTKPH